MLYETSRILNLWSTSVFTAKSERISRYSKDLKYFKSWPESRILIKIWQNLLNLESGLCVADPSHAMRSSQNVSIVKIPFRSRAMAFLIIAYCFCSHGKGDLRLATVVLSDTGDLSTLHYKQTIFGEEIHTLITFMISVMASDTVNGL